MYSNYIFIYPIMTQYEGFAEIDQGKARRSLTQFNQEYSNYSRNEYLNGSGAALETFLTRGGNVVVEGVDGYVTTVPPAASVQNIHKDVLSLQADIDNKLNELQQNDGSIAAEKQKYTDGLTYVGIIWATVTTTLLYFTFVKL
jgi:hypothetical protein